jgi:hypothetical protein
MITESLDGFLNDFGVPVVFGSISGLGIFDSPSSIVGGLSISNDYSVIVRASVFGALKYGDSVTVDGVAYKVREFQLLDDGKFGRAFLSKE